MMHSGSKARVVVVGGGITGLVAAHEIHRRGREVLLLEASPRCGGVIRSERDGDWLVEAGPNSLLDTSGKVRSLLTELGLEQRAVKAGAEARNRYVLCRGRTVPLPTSPGSFLLTPLFSPLAKLRLVTEPWRARGPADGNESIADFTRRRLGREFLDYAVDPFVTGIYAGDPDYLTVGAAFPKLHALEQTHGSLLRAALARRSSATGPRGGILSFPEGLGELVSSLSDRLGPVIRTGARVTSVERRQDGVWEVTLHNGESVECGELRIALPPLALARLRIHRAQGTSFSFERMGHVPHPPVVSLFLGYKREAVAHPLDGFGLLCPWKEGRRILGVLFSSTLFPGRAPTGSVALTVLLGGVRQPEITRLDDTALLALVGTELTQLLGVRGLPDYRKITRWERAIPQYGSWLAGARATARELERELPGLRIGGQALDGVSVPSCIEAGLALAEASAAAPTPSAESENSPSERG